ncbi:hypothetical protein FHS18_004957 [Paenibacillus phyllosphaerae]|uniref:Uncharacterized protein n=1 Tax=Paenibacillus phyllosphaerae TaxID=274593 RepID=A0A7W5FPX9_9BACL|nr:hypothetical protein [Paenibacillus phyllosphaerae]MBB3112855.1 hypothetical protein [Paenibacillus phyllosphaerae]
MELALTDGTNGRFFTKGSGYRYNDKKALSRARYLYGLRAKAITTEVRMTRAQQLFNTYLGHKLQMHREGLLKEYQSYAVSPEQEEAWKRELAAAKISSLSIRDWEAVAALRQLAVVHPDPAILSEITAFAARHVKSSDSLVKLSYAENMIDILKTLRKGGALDKSTMLEAARTAAGLLEAVIAQPLIADPGHELEAFGLKDKRSLNLRAKQGRDELDELIQ